MPEVIPAPSGGTTQRSQAPNESLVQVLTEVSRKLATGELPLFKATAAVKKLYGKDAALLDLVDRKAAGKTALVKADPSSTEIDLEGYYEELGAEAKRLALEQMVGMPLTTLRQTSVSMPVQKRRDGSIAPSFEQYLGGAGISIAGKASVNVTVEDQDKQDLYPDMKGFIPMAPWREGIVSGVSYGLGMLEHVKRYPKGSAVEVTVDRVSIATRSPTLSFASEAEAKRAIETIQSLTEPIRARADDMLDYASGKFDRIEFATLNTEDGRCELSVNFVYKMYGNYFGHEAATKYTGTLLSEVVLPALEKDGIAAERLWLAGGQDGDLRSSPKNIRGRKVRAQVFLPSEYLAEEFAIKDSESKVIKPGPSPQWFKQLSRSKNHLWNDFNGAVSHSGMEPEIIASIFSAIRPPSPPIVSSVVNVDVTVVEGGVIYGMTIPNFEWGLEGPRSVASTRDECECLMGVNSNVNDPTNAIRVAALVAVACIAGGLNQHRLAYTDGLAKTKRE